MLKSSLAEAPTWPKSNYNEKVIAALLILAVYEGDSRAETEGQPSESLRLQVLLDRANFRPGKIDGKGGEFTKKAEERYRSAMAIPQGSAIDLSSIPNPLTSYTISEEDIRWIGEQAETPEKQAELKKLLYKDLWELVAEKFHCDIDYLHELNPKASDIRPGTSLSVPDVGEFTLANLQDSNASQAEDVSLIILRDLSLVEVYRQNRLIASFPCTAGSEETPIPQGDWKITSNVYLPDFRWDESVLKTGVRSEKAFILPPGPNNPVGVVWIGINKPSLGIHGTKDPDQVGRNQSHGCVRLANWDAALLATLVKVGTPVAVK